MHGVQMRIEESEFRSRANFSTAMYISISTNLAGRVAIITRAFVTCVHTLLYSGFDVAKKNQIKQIMGGSTCRKGLPG